MSIPSTTTPDPEILTAATNAIAVGSVAYQTELERFRYVVTLSVRHGLPVGDAARAAGLTCEQITTLINQGEL